MERGFFFHHKLNTTDKINTNILFVSQFISKWMCLIWHEFRIRGGCCLRSRCWRCCFRAVNCDNGLCTRLSSHWCRRGLEKSSNWSGTNPPLHLDWLRGLTSLAYMWSSRGRKGAGTQFTLRWFLRHFGYCCLHRLVPGCDSMRYCHHLPVTIGCPSERFRINIHEWAIYF